MPLHPLVTQAIDAYLAAVDAEAPGLVEGLYLEGSAALDDFQPHASDVDFVAVTNARPDAAALAALARAHARVPQAKGQPALEGLYLTWEGLARGPGPPGPHACGGRFHAEGGVCSPVTWHTLARCGVACRGPAVAGVEVWTDREALAAWVDGNLDRYWRRWLERGSRLLSRHGLYSLTPGAAVWSVMGVSRLHYTLATGEITSKAGAGLYALQAFPERWHRVIYEALRIRRGEGGRSLYANPLARRRDALAFLEMAIEDGHRLHRRPA